MIPNSGYCSTADYAVASCFFSRQPHPVSTKNDDNPMQQSFKFYEDPRPSGREDLVKRSIAQGI